MIAPVMASRKTTPERESAARALRRLVKACLGPGRGAPRLHGTDLEALSGGLRVRLVEGESREDATQRALAELVAMVRGGRGAEVERLLELEDESRLREFELIAKRRLLDAHPVRRPTQALRHHVRATIEGLRKLPRNASFPLNLGGGGRFERARVRQATVAFVKELQKSPDSGSELVEEAISGDQAAQRAVTRQVLRALRERYVGGAHVSLDVETMEEEALDGEAPSVRRAPETSSPVMVEPPRGRKWAPWASRVALRLVERVERDFGPREALVLAYVLSGSDVREVARRLGMGVGTVSRTMSRVEPYLGEAIQREKGRVIVRRVDFQDSEWPSILREIGSAVTSTPAFGDPSRKRLRRIVMQLEREVGLDS